MTTVYINATWVLKFQSCLNKNWLNSDMQYLKKKIIEKDENLSQNFVAKISSKKFVKEIRQRNSSKKFVKEIQKFRHKNLTKEFIKKFVKKIRQKISS